MIKSAVLFFHQINFVYPKGEVELVANLVLDSGTTAFPVFANVSLILKSDSKKLREFVAGLQDKGLVASFSSYAGASFEIKQEDDLGEVLNLMLAESKIKI